MARKRVMRVVVACGMMAAVIVAFSLTPDSGYGRGHYGGHGGYYSHGGSGGCSRPETTEEQP